MVIVISKNTSFSLVSFSRQVTGNFKSKLYWSQPVWVLIIWIQWYIQISVNQIYKRYLYICKSFSAHTIISTIKLILHKILISAKCLISVSNKQLNERLQYFKTKNKKLGNLLSKNLVNQIKYSVPIVNLSNNYLTEKECVQLSFGLKHSFVEKKSL